MNNKSFLGSGNPDYGKYNFPINKNLDTQFHQSKYSSRPGATESELRSCALSLALQGNYSSAIALLTELINSYPDNAVDHNNRGLIYFEIGELLKAVYDYNIALELNPKLATAYNNRANYHAACGELTTALEDYDQAIDLNPSYVKARINRGITLRDLEEYEQAIETFQVALIFGQFKPHIWAQGGRTYHLWGDWNSALADYHRALTQLLSTDGNTSDYKLRIQLENWLQELLNPDHTYRR